EYMDAVRPGNMIIGLERTPKGRLWACWVGNGDNPNGFFMLATSDDGGATWSKPRVVIDPADPPNAPQRRALVGNLWTDPLGRLWLTKRKRREPPFQISPKVFANQGI